MPTKVERILFKVGEGSLAVTLPKPWVVYNWLKPGDTVEIIANDGLLIRAKTTPEPSPDGGTGVYTHVKSRRKPLAVIGLNRKPYELADIRSARRAFPLSAAQGLQ